MKNKKKTKKKNPLEKLSKEELGWLILAESSLKKDWENEYDKRWDEVL